MKNQPPHSDLTSQSQLTRAEEFFCGVWEECPLLLGVIPFGLVFGVLGLASGLSAMQTIFMSSILFGGASQIVFAQLWGAGTPSWIVASSVSVVNLRHVLYSASMSSYCRSLPLAWRMLLAYLLTDEAYVVSIKRFQTNAITSNSHFHLLGTGFTLWLGWQLSTIAGVLLGKTIPSEWQLEFAIPLTFIAIVAPTIKRRADLTACLVAGTLALIGQDLPAQSWIVLASIGGIVAGYADYYWTTIRKNQRQAVKKDDQ